MLHTVPSTLSDIHTNPIHNPVNVHVKKGFLISKQVRYIGLVTTAIECRVLNMTEDATHIFKKGAKKKNRKTILVTHSFTTKLSSDSLPI
jgi:hypothetical protein